MYVPSKWTNERRLWGYNTILQSFKSLAIASAIDRYSYLCMVALFELTCNLAAIASFSLLLAVFRVQPLNPLARYLEPDEDPYVVNNV